MGARRHVWQGVIIGAGAALTLAGLVGAQSTPTIGSGDIVADRQRLMKLNAASMKDINEKLKAGNIEAIAVNAETLALNAQHIPALFPTGSLTDKSNAKPEIWQRSDEFQEKAKNLGTWAVKLRDAAKTKDAAATEAIVKDFGRETCGACHTVFRKPLQQ
jgi:cytochrome c556